MMMEGNRKNNPSKISLVMRMVVSVYLLYLVWGLRGAPGSHTGVERLLFIAAMILFFAVAVVLGGTSIKAYLRGEYDRPEESDGSDGP